MYTKCLAFIAVGVILGCQETQVRQKSNLLVSTLPDLYYEQVLDNLARTSTNSGCVAYFATPTQGTNQQTRQVQGSYTPGLDLITNGATAVSGLIGHFVFDKQQFSIVPQIANQQSFQLSPVNDANKISLLRIAFRKAIGDPSVTNADVFRLGKFYSDTASSFSEDYYQAITGLPLPPAEEFEGGIDETVDSNAAFPVYRLPWLQVESKRLNAPKCACAVGEYCGTWVWVDSNDLGEFTKFTLAIMNIVSASPSGSSKFEFGFGVNKHLDGTIGDSKVDLKVREVTPKPKQYWRPPEPGGNQMLPTTKTSPRMQAPTITPTTTQFPYPAPP